MAILEKKTWTLLAGTTIGAGAVLAAPYLLPVLAAFGRRATKVTLKGAMIAYERGREQTGRMVEDVQDIVAEVRAEVHGELEEGEHPTPPEAGEPASPAEQDGHVS